MAKRAFISHISEDAGVAVGLKAALSRDFLNLLEVFASSDTESIAAGEEWLVAIEQALRESSLLLILCSPASIERPWINFEAGAAWMLKVPLVPLCYAGLTPRDLKMPLSLRQGVLLGEADGLRRLYARVAGVLSCQIPMRSFEELAREIVGARQPATSQPLSAELGREREIKQRLLETLQNQRFRWRSLGRVAIEAGISEEVAADLLRSDPEVRFSKGQSGRTIVGLRARVK